jgi:hypothetical protein
MDMAMRLFLLFYLFFLCQDDTVILLEGEPDVFTCDNLDNVYIYSNNVLKKYNSKGKLEANYSSLVYGSISSVDVSDPMRIAVFCKEFNTVLLLDKKFNLIGEPISLDQIGFTSVSCICESRQNGIWIFDSFSQKLILYSVGFKSVLREIDLQKYSKALSRVNHIIESGDRIFFYGKACALMDIGQFGGRLEILDIFPSNLYQVKNDQVLYTYANALFSYNLNTDEKKSFPISGLDCFDDIKVGYDKVFVLKNDTVQILNKNIR